VCAAALVIGTLSLSSLPWMSPVSAKGATPIRPSVTLSGPVQTGEVVTAIPSHFTPGAAYNYVWQYTTDPTDAYSWVSLIVPDSRIFIATDSDKRGYVRVVVRNNALPDPEMAASPPYRVGTALKTRNQLYNISVQDAPGAIHNERTYVNLRNYKVPRGHTLLYKTFTDPNDALLPEIGTIPLDYSPLPQAPAYVTAENNQYIAIIETDEYDIIVKERLERAVVLNQLEATSSAIQKDGDSTRVTLTVPSPRHTYQYRIFDAGDAVRPILGQPFADISVDYTPLTLENGSAIIDGVSNGQQIVIVQINNNDMLVGDVQVTAAVSVPRSTITK